MKRPDLNALRIVVVDDSEHMCKLIKLMLSAFGIRQVRTYTDGAEAMRAMQAEPVDLLLCDWEMKPIDGLTLVRKVRHFENSFLAGLPIIMITGNTDAHKIREARAAGVTHVVTKPVTPQILFDRIVWALANPAGVLANKAAPKFDAGGGAGRASVPMP